MILRIGDFRVNKPTILAYYKKDGLDSALFAAMLSSVPIVAACCFILEEFEDEEVRERMESVSEFYGYREVIE